MLALLTESLKLKKFHKITLHKLQLGELKHGTIALADYYCVVANSTVYLFDKMVFQHSELRRNAHVSRKEDLAIEEHSDDFYVQKCMDEVSYFILLSLPRCQKKGMRMSEPRNLAKV